MNVIGLRLWWNNIKKIRKEFQRGNSTANGAEDAKNWKIINSLKSVLKNQSVEPPRRKGRQELENNDSLKSVLKNRSVEPPRRKGRQELRINDPL
jgi:hypothetical protein